MSKKKNIVVFTGAGVSADSGIATFRDADGLWANYRIEEVCTPEALRNNREKVVEFYNLRRKESLTKKPNAGHIAIAEMEQLMFALSHRMSTTFMNRLVRREWCIFMAS